MRALSLVVLGILAASFGCGDACGQELADAGPDAAVTADAHGVDAAVADIHGVDATAPDAARDAAQAPDAARSDAGLDYSCDEPNTYFVSPAGQDGDDGSLDAPWATIQHAVESTAPGDTICLRAGTYDEPDFEFRGDRGHGGDDSSWLTIQAFPGEEAVISSPFYFRMYMVTHVRIRGLHFTNQSGVSLGRWTTDGLPRSRFVHVVGNRFTGPQRQYAFINVVGNDNLFEHNVIIAEGGGNESQDHGIYVAEGERNVVRGNYIEGTTSRGIHVYDEDKGDGPPTLRDITIEDNIVVGSRNRAGIIVATGRDGTVIDGVLIRNNVCVGNATHGIEIIYGGDQLRNVQCYNNTLHENGANGIQIDSDVRAVDMVNNLIVQSSGMHINCMAGATNVTADNNLFFGQGAPNLSGVTDGSAVTGDPLFESASARDFHLQLESAARDTGAALSQVPTDIEGISRPQGDAFDIGAYEHH